MTSRLDEFLRADDPEYVLFRHLRESLAALRDRPPAAPWREGKPLRVLLGGYLGAGNVGSEMRSHEVVRHLTHLLGESNASFTALINGPYRSAIASDQVSFTRLDGYIPDALIDLASTHSAVVAVEGSMLKSSFSNVLSGIMAGALATATDGLAVGYGAEIGAMEPLLEDFARDVLQSTLFLCRNAPSRVRAGKLGLRAEEGSDTAWTFDAMAIAEADAYFRRAGIAMDGPVVIVCPTNPFWWPVRPNPGLAARAEADTSLRQWQYADVFFHAFDSDRQRRFERYADEMAVAAGVIASDRRAGLLLLAMDPTDGPACRALRDRLGPGTPIVYGHDHPVGAIAALLRRAAFLVSSRYHALVAAAPGGIPFAGVSTDERIVNLLTSCGADARNVPGHEVDLATRLIAISRGTVDEEVRHVTRALVRREVFMCGRMGLAFVEEVRRRVPGFPVPSRPPRWDAHLPPLPPTIEELMAA